MGPLKKVVGFISLVMLASGCGGDKSSVGPDLGADRCSGPLTVTASADATPTFNWSPSCKATNLYVTRADAPATEPPIWSVGGEPHEFGPYVRYGVAPAGVPAVATPPQLETGVRYRVVVYATVGLDVETSSGATTFVP